MSDKLPLPYRTSGRVVPGAGRGRTLGFPTANLDTGLPAKFPLGIYAGWAQLSDPPIRLHPEGANLKHPPGVSTEFPTPGVGKVRKQRWPTVIYWGRRPTFDGGSPVLELFLLDLPAEFPDLTSREKITAETTLEVDLVAFLRPDERFETTAALVAAMERDVVTARQLLTVDSPR